MLKNPSKILFLIILMMGTMISISSNSWLSAWMGLEINLLAFIPLMSIHTNLMSTEASMKYFLTQALASSVLLFSAILMMMINISIPFQINLMEISSIPNIMILSSLLMKSGAAPFHFWFPSVMEGLSWTNNLILMIWQKIAPLMLISYLMMKSIIYWVIISSIIIGSIGGLNQTSLRKIMAFSSINHLGWMLAAMLSNENLWIIYFLIYTLLSFNMIFLFNSFQLIHINQLFSLFFSSKILKFTLFMNLLSLGGLPPFLGFLPKWLVIQSLVSESQFTLMTMMTIFTLITLYFYIRMCYSAFMMNYNEPNWILMNDFKSKYMKSFLMFSFASNYSLFIVSMIYSFI